MHSVSILTECRSFVSLGMFILRYLILFDAVVNGIASWISLSDLSLLMYRNATDFFVLFCKLQIYKFIDEF